MKTRTIPLTLLLGSLVAPASAMVEDDPILTMVKIDQLERRFTGGDDPWVLEADAWIGRDFHKAWFKFDVEHVDGHLEEFEVQALYSRAVDIYWDLQVGWRHDGKPEPSQDWLAVGVMGLAPYWFEVDIAAFVNDDGQINLRLQGEYEWMLTQRWVLVPELELNLYSKRDDEREIGSGLSDLQAGLRLRYEIRREFAPYIGVNWNRKFAGTADHAREADEDVSDVQFVVGIHSWF